MSTDATEDNPLKQHSNDPHRSEDACHGEASSSFDQYMVPTHHTDRAKVYSQMDNDHSIDFSLFAIL